MCDCGQGPLRIFDDRTIAQDLQTSLVPWLISRFGVAYKRDGSPEVVRDMITALIVRDNIGGMAREIDLLKARHKNAFDEIAKRAWCTALRGLNQHRQKIRVSVQEIFNARKESDVVANKVVERVFGQTTLDPLLDIQSASLRHLAAGTTTPALACIWESPESHREGFRTILQSATKVELAGVESLFDFLGECLPT